jgi:hypothetical protein
VSVRTSVAAVWRRALDFFARLVDGGGVVVDVRADDQIPDNDAQAGVRGSRSSRAEVGVHRSLRSSGRLAQERLRSHCPDRMVSEKVSDPVVS